ncbi:hypothetical protein [Sphingobium sp. WCS2017Hpa-17]|nr:hypothetical protein [Sphingobium sp. WCS2017Hpa-17]
MGNFPAGDFAHLTHIADPHRASQINFNQFDVGVSAFFSNGKEADHAR